MILFQRFKNTVTIISVRRNDPEHTIVLHKAVIQSWRRALQIVLHRFTCSRYNTFVFTPRFPAQCFTRSISVTDKLFFFQPDFSYTISSHPISVTLFFTLNFSLHARLSTMDPYPMPDLETGESRIRSLVEVCIPLLLAANQTGEI